MHDFDKFFAAKSVAIVGVSRDNKKVGHVIFRNFVDAGYKGKVYPVNISGEEILGRKTYKTLLDIKDKIELVIIAVPAAAVFDVIEQCRKKKIGHVIMVTAGFKEEGRLDLDKKLQDMLDKYKIKVIGPNCLGTFDAHTRLDSLFLPRYRLQRPKEGGISFVCQSGAVGSSILDLATNEGYGFSKFVSYGNAMNTDESDLLEYLGNDKKTKVICLYVEGAKNGQKFIKTLTKVSKKKPIVVLKGGRTEAGSKAAMSHTGSLAGSSAVYSGVFKQAGAIEVDSLEEMFETAKALEKLQKPKGKRILVITNGGGYGILSTDAVIKNGLEMTKLSKESDNFVKANLARVQTHNPIDLLGDANTEGYRNAIQMALADTNTDIVLVIVLYQTPLVTTDIVDIIIEAHDMNKKPIVIVSAGGEFTDVLSKNVEANGVPTYTFPENAIRAIKNVVAYYGK